MGISVENVWNFQVFISLKKCIDSFHENIYVSGLYASIHIPFSPIVICSLSIWNSNTYPLAFVMLLFLPFLLSSPFSSFFLFVEECSFLHSWLHSSGSHFRLYRSFFRLILSPSSCQKSTLFLSIFFLICSLFKLSACCLTLCRSYLCSARKCAVLSVELQSSQRNRPTNWEGTGKN